MLLALTITTASVGLAEADVAFESANRLYEQGRFAEAAAAYERLVAAGQLSPALLYNLGNAAFKNGQIGRAIAGYRRAELLAPRDPDVRANLRFARNTASGAATDTDPPWRDWMIRLKLDEWTLLAAAPLSVWFLLLAAGQFRPAWQPALRGHLVWLGITAALLAGLTTTVLVKRFSATHAVVVSPEAVVRYGPVDESQSHFVLRDGAEVTVLDHKDRWLQITDAARRTGWLKRDQVVVLNLHSPLDPAAHRSN